MVGRDLGISYDITPDLVHKVVQVPGHGLKNIDSRKFDVVPAAEVPHLSGVFHRALENTSIHSLALVVKTPKAVRKARRRAMLEMGL
jgi:hypothetical protein